MQQQNIVEPIKKKQHNNQPAGKTIKKSFPMLPTKQKQHVVLDENVMLNVPNLVE